MYVDLGKSVKVFGEFRINIFILFHNLINHMRQYYFGNVLELKPPPKLKKNMESACNKRSRYRYILRNSLKNENLTTIVIIRNKEEC